jgi:hypothetical protein
VEQKPEVVTDWAIPEGKSMKDLFTSFSPEGKENLKLFPLMTHHNPTVTGKKAMCIKYQCRGKCRAGCPQTHVRPANIAANARTKIDRAFTKVYG